MKVLITGGAGFVGSEFGKYLHSKGIDVVPLDNMEYGYEDNLSDCPELHRKLIIDDVRNKDFSKFLEGIDVVFHFAGISSLPECESNPGKAFDVNTVSIANILSAARSSKVKRFVFASTSAIYENNKESIFNEELPVFPNLIYATTKYCAENLCRSFAQNYDMDIVICRFFNVFGPHQDFKRAYPPFTSYLIREISAGQTPTVFNTSDVKRDYIYTKDLVVFLESMMNSNKRYCADVFNLCSGKGYSAIEIVQTIFKLFNKETTINTGDPAKFWDKYTQLFDKTYNLSKERISKEVFKHCIGSPDKANKEFNYSCKYNLENGLIEVIDYQRNAKM